MTVAPPLVSTLHQHPISQPTTTAMMVREEGADEECARDLNEGISTTSTPRSSNVACSIAFFGIISVCVCVSVSSCSPLSLTLHVVVSGFEKPAVWTDVGTKLFGIRLSFHSHHCIIRCHTIASNVPDFLLAFYLTHVLTHSTHAQLDQSDPCRQPQPPSSATNLTLSVSARSL